MTKAEQKAKLNKLAKLLRDNPETTDRLTEYLEEKTGIEVIIEDIKPKRFYKIAEVMEILTTSRQTIYNLIEAKEIITVKISTYQKIAGQDIINYLLKNES